METLWDAVLKLMEGGGNCNDEKSKFDEIFKKGKALANCNRDSIAILFDDSD